MINPSAQFAKYFTITKIHNHNNKIKKCHERKYGHEREMKKVTNEKRK